jgi:hypothetical protein
LFMKLPVRSFVSGVAFVFFACCLVGAQSSIRPASGKAMCSALTPSDFSKAGIPVSALGQANTDGNEGAYCVYKSSAGKVEFDIFYPAGASPAEVSGTEKTVLNEAGGKLEPIRIAGADSAHIALSLSGQPASASIVVRKGRAVFDILIPKGAKSRRQLTALAGVVLGRIK